MEPEHYCSMNTWQYPDYDRYEHDIFDMDSKRESRDLQFPLDREACRQMGRRLALRASGADDGGR